jgi:glycolate oxidase FAD binding subunit
MAKLAERVLAARLPLLGLELTGASGTSWTLRTSLGGGATAVARAMAEVNAMALNAGTAVAPGGNSVDSAGTVEVRVSVQPTRTFVLAEALSAAGAQVVAYPATGTLRGVCDVAPKAETLTSLRRTAIEDGGALVLEAGPPELKNEVGVWGNPRSDFVLIQRLKQQFDPKQTLNPGRFVGGI